MWEVHRFGPDQIETDFAKLRRADTWKNGAGYWGPKMDALLGTYVTPAVVLANDVDQARAIGRALDADAKKPPLDEMVASVRTLEDVLPGDQDAKIALADRIADDLTPRIRASLTDEQRKTVEDVYKRQSAASCGHRATLRATCPSETTTRKDTCRAPSSSTGRATSST